MAAGSGCTIHFIGDQTVNVAESLAQVGGEMNGGIGPTIMLHQHGDPAVEILVVKENITYVRAHRS